MSTLFDDIKTFLPKYLSEEATVSLFRELASFPSNIDTRMYTLKLKDEQILFQGDGLSDLWISDLPGERRERSRVMVLSNTCDVAPENKRLLGPRVRYAEQPALIAKSHQEALRAWNGRE